MKSIREALLPKLAEALRQALTLAAGWIDRQALSLLILALLAALLGQSFLDKDKQLASAGALYGLAAIAFVLVCRGIALERRPDEDAARSAFPWLSVILAAIAGALAFPRFTGNLFRLDGTLMWLGGLLLLALGAWEHRPKPFDDCASSDSRFKLVSPQGLRITPTQIALLAIMALGAFLRLYQIDRIPLEMGCDLPHNYNNIRLILRSEFLIFFPSYPGRESLFFYLAAPLCRLFGLNHTMIKASAGLVGVATIPLVYLLAKELYNREAGLYAAFLLSVSHWHIIINRNGYRASTVPLLLALTLYFWVRAVNSQRRWFFALAGLFLGLGMYTYNAFMIVPALMGLLALTLLVTGRARTLRANLGNIALMFVVALYVFIPLGRYAYEQPQSYGYRAMTRITGAERALEESVIDLVLTNTRKALLMFNYRGDAVVSGNVPYLRELGYLTAVLFVLGFAYLLWRWRRGNNLLPLVTLGVMLLPTIMALAFPQKVPNAIRAIGALPAAVIIAAAALAVLRNRLSSALAASAPRAAELSLALEGSTPRTLRIHWERLLRHGLTLLLLWAACHEARGAYNAYFQDYVAHIPNNNYSITLEMARAIDDFADSGIAYIKAVPFWYEGDAVRAQLTRVDQSWHNEIGELRPDQPPLAGPPGKFMVILHPQDSAALNLLRERFPTGIALYRRDNQGQIALIIFYGERL